MDQHDSIDIEHTPLETFMQMFRRYVSALGGLPFGCKPSTPGILNYRWLPDHAETKLGLSMLALQSLDMAVRLLPGGHAIQTAHAAWLMGRLGHPYHGVQPAHIRHLVTHHMGNHPASPTATLERTTKPIGALEAEKLRLTKLLCGELLGRAALQDAIILTMDEPDPSRPSHEACVRELLVEMGLDS